MTRYFIEKAECGIIEGGMACGPISGNIVVTIQFKDDSKTQWLSLVEVDGIPNVYLSDKDVHKDLVAEDFNNIEFDKYLNDHYIFNFNGIDLDVDYYSTFESIATDPENPAVPLIRYLITLVRCDMDSVEKLIQMASGRYVDELDIPISDVEKDFMDD